MRRHRYDPVSFGAACIFLYVVVFTATGSVGVDGDAAFWLVPGVLTIAGLAAGLLAVERGTRPRPATAPVTAAAPPGVDDRWGRFVVGADRARQRFDLAVASTPPGPLHDRLAAVGTRIAAGVDEVARVAARAQSLERASALLDRSVTTAALARAEAELAGDPANRHLLAEVASLEAQQASAERMASAFADATARLRVLEVRLDEAVARAIELSVGTVDESGMRGLDRDVDDIVEELESVRLALDDANAP